MATSVRRPHPPGVFCWSELATKDAKAAAEFYTALFGWAVSENPTDMGPYYVYKRDGDDVGAAYEARAEEGPPHWNSYVSVASADESASRAAELGGSIIAPPFDVFDLGRMAVLRDPGGAFLNLWQAKKSVGAMRKNEPGTLCWNELATTDVNGSEKFYKALFGWTAKKGTAPPGEYTEFHNKGEAVGGMLRIQPEWGSVPPHWLPYFAVVDCDASADRASENGAAMHVPPTDIPQVGRFAVVRDPQGAAFAIIALRAAA
jgi:predicted enzyme related to lactoylglutathione lyase